MAITYPLIFPTHVGPARITLRARNVVSISQSPFTFKQQAFEHQGKRFEAEVKLPPMSRVNAEAWIGWLLSLNGRLGTFLMGDPAGTVPMGEGGGSPTVTPASQVGKSLGITAATFSQATWLKAGDYFQIGTGSGAQLYKVTQDAATDGAGASTLEIWPALRTSPALDAPLIVNNTVGVWRLASNDQSWDIDSASIYGINFAAVEATA